MPCGQKKKAKFARIRAVDVGRPGHHYLKIGVTTGGKTEPIGGLRTYKNKKRR